MRKEHIRTEPLPVHLVVGCKFLALVTGVRIPDRQQLTASTRSVKKVLSQLAPSTMQLQKTPQASPEQKSTHVIE